MKKYYITYSDKQETIIADSYAFDDTFLHFSIKGKVIFMVNKSLILSMSVSTEKISYNDIDLFKLLTDNFITEYNIDEKDEYFEGRLDVHFYPDNIVSSYGQFNKKFYPNEKKVKNTLTKDIIIRSIKSLPKK